MSDDFTLLGLFAAIIAEIGIALITIALFFGAVIAISYGIIYTISGIYWLFATFTMIDIVVLTFLVGVCLVGIGVVIDTVNGPLASERQT